MPLRPAPRRIPAQGHASDPAVPPGAQLQILRGDSPVFHWTAGSSRSFTSVDWYRGPGSYTAIVLPPSSMFLRIGQTDFHITGDELRIIIQVDQPQYPIGTQSLPTPRVLRVLDGSDLIEIVRDWAPSTTGEPRYTIRNKTVAPLFGRGMDNTFRGRIEKPDGSHFGTYFRGYCGGPYSAHGRPLPPGARVTSKEPYRFSAYLKSTKLQPGRYRYVVRFSKQPPTTEAGDPLFEVHDDFMVQ